MSPAFLYRVEAGPRPEAALDGWELASRISFFCGRRSRTTSRGAAAAGELRDPGKLAGRSGATAEEGATPGDRVLRMRLGFYHFDQYRGS
jgi:hypothetical protein